MVAIVSVEEPAPVREAGLKVAVAPDGNPLTVKFSVPLNPLSAEVATVYVAFAGATIV